MNGFGSDPHKVPPYFDIAPDATGGLLLSDQVFSRGAGYAREERAPFVYRKSSSAQDGNESSLGSFLVSLDRCAQKPALLFPFSALLVLVLANHSVHWEETEEKTVFGTALHSAIGAGSRCVRVQPMLSAVRKTAHALFLKGKR